MDGINFRVGSCIQYNNQFTTTDCTFYNNYINEDKNDLLCRINELNYQIDKLNEENKKMSKKFEIALLRNDELNEEIKRMKKTIANISTAFYTFIGEIIKKDENKNN